MSLNKVMIIGNLGADPEVRYTQSGAAVGNFNVATNEVWTDKSGARQERTEWHRVVVFGKQAENCGKYLSKGRQVYVEGRLQTREWEDRDGNKRTTTEVIAQTVQFLSGDSDGPRRNGAPESSRGGSQGGGSAPSGYSQSFNDDDIPF